MCDTDEGAKAYMRLGSATHARLAPHILILYYNIELVREVCKSGRNQTCPSHMRCDRGSVFLVFKIVGVLHRLAVPLFDIPWKQQLT
jgi:hypothetical protein